MGDGLFLTLSRNFPQNIGIKPYPTGERQHSFSERRGSGIKSLLTGWHNSLIEELTSTFNPRHRVVEAT